MKILIDECTPRLVKKRLPSYYISTVQEMGWSGVKNGELLKLAEANFDVLITCDQNLRHQQNLKDRKLAFIVLPSNQVPIVEKLIADIDAALKIINEGDLVEIPLP
jgi:predicted nuclease of predicted toxin-antitoxin system